MVLGTIMVIIAVIVTTVVVAPPPAIPRPASNVASLLALWMMMVVMVVMTLGMPLITLNTKTRRGRPGKAELQSAGRGGGHRAIKGRNHQCRGCGTEQNPAQ